MEESNDVIIVTNVYGDFCVRKARRKRQKVLVRELLFDYANNTTLHGLPYVTRTGLTIIEKIFWLLTFLTSVSLCLFLISKVWFKWQTSPVIVTVSEQPVPVSTVPFPSVTICPQSKSKVSEYNYTAAKARIKAFTAENHDTMNSTMREQIKKYLDITKVCNVFDEFYMLSRTYYPNEESDASVFENILKVAPNYTDVFGECFVHGEYQTCEDIFNIVVTSEGICYNMNSLAANEIFRSENIQHDYPYLDANKPRKGWSMEGGYESTPTNVSGLDFFFIPPSYYPLPGAENGATPDVEIILLDYPQDRDLLCNVISSGYKVYIQHPSDLPQSGLYYYAVINSQVSSMALSFSILNTSESLRGYDPEIRQCYFPDERSLKYFTFYTASNCRLECWTNVTLDRCGCVDFFMPYESSKNICTMEFHNCVRNARVMMQLQEAKASTTKCHCLPSCNSVDYEAEILKTDYNLKQYLKVHSKVSNYETVYKGYKFSKLELYFKRPRFLSMRRSELFGLIDFLANCGGLLGLFLGFSFLSLVEIFYFLTLRLCCTLKKDLEEEKVQAPPGEEVHVDKY